MSDTATQDTSARSDSGATPDDKQQTSNTSTDTTNSAKQQAATKDQSGQRDAATDDTDTGDHKPAGDTSKLEKALANERQARKDAEQAAKDKQAEVEKATKAQQEQLDALGKALGFKKDDAPPDPEALQRALAERDAKLTDAQAEKDREVQSRDDTIRQQRVELAAWRIGSDPKLGANVAALLDSRRVADSIKDMDPASDNFEKDLAAVIKTTVEGNDVYRATRPSSASEAGIGATGAKNGDVNVAPGASRLRAAYGTS